MVDHFFVSTTKETGAESGNIAVEVVGVYKIPNLVKPGFGKLLRFITPPPSQYACRKVLEGIGKLR
jgi:hypothetical protein